jgi:hypothetical protein
MSPEDLSDRDAGQPNIMMAEQFALDPLLFAADLKRGSVNDAAFDSG